MNPNWHNGLPDNPQRWWKRILISITIFLAAICLLAIAYTLFGV